jgi:hypothetical protein
MAVIATNPVTVGDALLVTVFARLASNDDRPGYAKALAEIDEWCATNGFHRTENWPSVKNINNQSVVVAACVRD